MNFIITKPRSQKEVLLFEKINKSVAELQIKIGLNDLNKIGLSAYNQRYLKEYLDNFTFFARFYTQVFIIALRELKKPVEESVFVDYGGGSGFFSLLAKLTGFGTVIYNDIYDVSVNDAKVLSMASGIAIDHFVSGDIDDLVLFLNAQKTEPDLICSFEVIEHIYNLKTWFGSAQKIKGNFSLVFSSSANSKNPYISRRLKKGQQKAEFRGNEKSWGSKERDAVKSFLKIREEIIAETFPRLAETDVNILAAKTRGFSKEDLVKAVQDYLNSGKNIESLLHPTNTCDPNTGNWSEHLIDQKWLTKIVEQNGFKKVKIVPGLYTYSENKFVLVFKKILNVLIRISGNSGLLISPVFILKATKKN